MTHPFALPHSDSAPGPIASRTSGGSIPALFGWWLQRRKDRRALANLSDHLLHDIGLSREEAMREAAKPFWRR